MIRASTVPSRPSGLPYRTVSPSSGEPYVAKWSNQGVAPGAELSDPSGSPWRALFRIPGEPTG